MRTSLAREELSNVWKSGREEKGSRFRLLASEMPDVPRPVEQTLLESHGSITREHATMAPRGWLPGAVF